MSCPKVAIVTGGNKGIGFAIAKGLCQKFQGIVYITTRCPDRGLAAVKTLQDEGYSANVHQLNIDNAKSIQRLAEYMKIKYGGIDLLVNNAAVGFWMGTTEPVACQAIKTVTTNYFGTLHLCEALFPLLRQNARVVNISSSLGHLSYIPHEKLREKLSNIEMPISELSDLMNLYLADCKETEVVKLKWGLNCYIATKVCISALTRIQQKLFDKETPYRNISINSVHPGYVSTDMTNHSGPFTIDEGAKAPLYLCLEAQDLKGQYVWYDCSVVDWLAPTRPDSEQI